MKYLALTLFMFFSLTCFSQNEANIWYFGENAGLDFNSGIPVALTDGQLDTLEGCSTISDANGNLLFYSDGVTVWNANHTVMLNGTGLNGHASSTHSALVIPKPGDSDIYYIFTVDRILNFGTSASSDGLQYSEVDMTLDGGLGGVTTNKNILLESLTTEKLTAVKNASGDGFWVLSHKGNSDEYIAYEVTSTGVNTTPVVSALGTVVAVNGSNQEQNNAIGQIKFSPDGTKVAVARRGNINEVVLLDFNTLTGQLSNPITLLDGLGNSPSEVYGIEFSPDSSVLYSSATSGEVFQFDLNAGTDTDIINSQITIQSSSNFGYSGMQLGPDCKIYITKLQGSLDVIDDPNVVGTGCNYTVDGVFLDGKLSKLGLPPFNQSVFEVNFDLEDENGIVLDDELIFCEDEEYILYTTEILDNSVVYSWYQDGIIITGADTSSLTITESGTYNVFASIPSLCGGSLYEDEIIIGFGFSENDVFDVVDEYCLDDGITTITLSDYDSVVYTGSTNVNITYHLSLAEAETRLAQTRNQL